MYILSIFFLQKELYPQCFALALCLNLISCTRIMSTQSDFRIDNTEENTFGICPSISSLSAVVVDPFYSIQLNEK